ncbi:uncharacterized protein LOC135115118 [Scylla paramamosain]|uniref:uncharacterized protein LOC135115118 n=1 Tax=Scylla paramamosain TaxID=85552 RepID=UPI0030829A20
MTRLPHFPSVSSSVDMSRQQLLFRPPDHRLSCPLLLLLLVSVVETYLAVTDNVKSWQAGNGDVVLFCESDSKFFNRTNRLALVHCGEAECGEYFSLSCVLPDTGLTSFCSESGLEEPLNAVTTKDFIYDKLLLPSVLAGRYYTCSRGMIWNGGEGPGRLAVCWNREWNNITDSCVIDPTVPRDCSELAARGFNTSDVYLTRPDGVSQLVTEVWCDLDDQQEGAWMTVLKVDTNSQLPDQYKDSMYFYGFGSPDDTTFFIGFHHLANLTLESDSSRPLVLQVLLTTSDGGEYHVTYDNVTFGEAPQRRLLSLGSVHGNAGDGLRGAEGKSVQSGQNSFWWLSQERTSNLFALSWFPFYGEGKDLAKVVVRVRPQEYDASVACPPLGVSVEAWRDPPVHLTGHVPDSRAPGVTVNITCVKKMYGFDMSGEVRRKTEFLICEEQANGGPAWNSSFSPCQLLCPAEFEPFPEFDVCLHQEPPEQSSYGATSSTLRCAGEEGATLATAYDIPYDQLSTDPNPAMTIHRVVGDNIVPSLPATMTCHEEDHHCQASHFKLLSPLLSLRQLSKLGIPGIR